MRTKLSLTILMLLFCLSVFGQQSINNPTTRKPSTSLIQSSTNQQETIYQLQAENQNLQNRLERMEKEHERLEMEVDFYRNDIRANMSQWLTILSIIMGLIGVTFGIGVPILINRDNSKRLESRFLEMKEDLKNQVAQAAGQATRAMNQTIETTKQATEAKSQAAEAKNQAAEAAKQAGITQETLKEMNALKDRVTEIQKKINKDATDAEKAAKDVKANQIFAQAVNEIDDIKAISLYTQAISLKPDYYEAYHNRGFRHKKIGELDKALQDYKDAIKFNENYADSYNGRANVYLAKGELDKALKEVKIAIRKDKFNYYYYDTKGQVLLAMVKMNDALDEFNKSLSLNENYLEAIENRAKCYRRMAQMEVDEAKKAGLIDKAEADEKKAETLKKKK